MTTQCKKLRNILWCALLVCASATLSLSYSQGQTSNDNQPGGDAATEPLPTRWMSSDGSVRMPHAVPVKPERFEMVPVAPRGAVKRSQDGILPPATGDRICLVVGDAVYDDITAGLTTYIADLEAEGYVVITYRFVSGGATELRDSLIKLFNEPQSLAGAQFIGAIPHIVYEMMQRWSASEPEEYEDFPCDLFFMDLHGTWSDALDYGSVVSGNGKYDTWSGDRTLDIWVSRLKTDNLPALGTDAQLLTHYFSKNHAWRQRTLAPSQSALLYIDDDWASNPGSDDLTAMSTVYDPASITFVTDPEGTSATDYKTNRLPAVGEMLFTRSHGNPTGHGYYTNSKGSFGYVYPSDYRTIVPDALFHSFFVCSGTDFTASGNLAGSVVFNEGTGLLAWGSTKTGGMLYDEYFYGPISEGKSFGEAFRSWFNAVRNYSIAPRWWYGMAMIGDGTLRPSTQTFKLAVSLPESAEEGDGTVEGAASVTLPWPLDADMMVGLASSDPTELTVAESLLIPAGSRSVTFPITVIDDHINDGIQSVTVTVSANLWTSASDNMTITDNNDAPLVGFAASEANGPESLTVVTVNVCLNLPSTLPASVSYDVTGGSATNGGVDYTLESGTLSFAPGDTVETITLSVINDGVPESDETIVIKLADAVNIVPGEDSVFTYTIKNDDVAPVITSDSIVTAVEDEEFTYLVSVSDPSDTPLVTFGTIPSWLDTTGILIHGTPTDGDMDTFFTVIAFDGYLSDTLTVRLTVEPVNDTPRIVSEPVTVAVEHKEYRYDVEATDPDEDDTLLFSLLVAPHGMTIDSRSGEIIWVPGYEHVGDTTVVVKVSDNAFASDTQRFTVTVSNTDDPPQLVSAQSDTASQGVYFVYHAEATDPDETTPSYIFEQLPPWLVAKGDSIYGTPKRSDTNTTVRVIATDGALYDTLMLDIFVIATLNGAPVCVMEPLPSLCRDVISIHYTLSDPENELLRLELFYEYEGEWIRSGHTSGVIENIIPSAYGGTLLWLSPKHFPAIKTDSLRIKLVPFDADSGTAAVSNRFVIDNRSLARVSAYSPAGLMAPDGRGSITVTFSTDVIDTEAVENGAVSITGSTGGTLPFEASVNGALLTLRPAAFPVATETLTVSITQEIFPSNGSLLDCNGNGRLDEEADDTCRIKIPVSRLGDFNLDDDVNFGDLSYLSSYWYASASGSFDADSISETGPVSGEAPLFLVHPDSRFDFEDIDAFIHSWHWSHEHFGEGSAAAKRMAARSGCAKKNAQPAETLSARAAAIQKASLQHVKCGGAAALRLTLDVENVSKLVACSYSISFDPRTVAPIDIETSSLLESKNGRAIAMRSDAQGSLDLDMVRLCATDRDVSGSGEVATVTFAKKSAKAGATVTVSYTLMNSSHELIESGTIALDLSDAEIGNENFADGRLRVAPNPSKAATSAARFEFADNSSALVMADDGKGGFVFLFDIAGRKDASNTAALQSVAVRGYIKIYNSVGSLVASTPQGTIDALCGDPDSRPFSIYWDGRASGGSLLAPGVYHAVLVYSSPLGNGKMSAQVGVKR